MRERVGAIAIVVVFLTSAAWAQGAAPPSLQDQLSAQYTMVTMGTDSNGPAVLQPGTILTIQKGGILGVPYDNVAMAPAKYQDGTLHPPAATQTGSAGNVGKKLCGLFGKCNGVKEQVGQQTTSHFFQVGNKVYPSKLEVNTSKDTVTLSVVACDSCNKTDPTTFYKSEVVFEFPKGSLAAMSVPKVEDTISQVFSMDQGGDSQQGQDDQGGQDQQAGDQQGGDQQAGNQQAGNQQQAPESIAKGQTIDQVVASWGQPQRIVNLGAKQIYIYQDAKITFLNGKVSDVQ
jgi:hypothetical protein